MKIILEIPNEILPPEVKAAIQSGKTTPFQNRQLVRTMLELGLEVFDECEISVDQYRLVMK